MLTFVLCYITLYNALSQLLHYNGLNFVLNWAPQFCCCSKVVVSRGAAAPPAKRQKNLDKYVKKLYSAKSVPVIRCLRNV